jgi:hypothetical protein
VIVGRIETRIGPATIGDHLFRPVEVLPPPGTVPGPGTWYRTEVKSVILRGLTTYRKITDVCAIWGTTALGFTGGDALGLPC